MNVYLLIKISAMVLGLRKYIIGAYTAIRTNEFNYAKIQNCGGGDYLIYLKKISWLDNLRITIKSNDETKKFFDFKRFTIHNIRFDNTVEVDIPNNLNRYSIIVQYDLKLLRIFKKRYKSVEKTKCDIIGENKIKKLRYKIIEG